MKDDRPEIGDNVWHYLYKGGWVESFPDRHHVQVEFYRDAMADDPLRWLERDEFIGAWRMGLRDGYWHIEIT